MLKVKTVKEDTTYWLGDLFVSNIPVLCTNEQKQYLEKAHEKGFFNFEEVSGHDNKPESTETKEDIKESAEDTTKPLSKWNKQECLDYMIEHNLTVANAEITVSELKEIIKEHQKAGE